MRLAVIPARGGSKRIPRKNVRPFCGRPIIEWSIKAARESGCFDRIVVSTDDAEIAELALLSGVDVPFTRPAGLADDHATTAAVIAHAVKFFQDAGQTLTAVCCIYATAPLIRAEDINEALKQLEAGDRDFAFPVTSFPFHIERALRMTANGGVEMVQPEHQLTRSQELEDAYHDAGQFYWGRPDAWLLEKDIYSPRSAAIVIPRRCVQDIDTPEDWEHAEWMFRAMKGG